jgi:hypothetical protein
MAAKIITDLEEEEMSANLGRGGAEIRNKLKG